MRPGPIAPFILPWLVTARLQQESSSGPSSSSSSSLPSSSSAPEPINLFPVQTYHRATVQTSVWTDPSIDLPSHPSSADNSTRFQSHREPQTHPHPHPQTHPRGYTGLKAVRKTVRLPRTSSHRSDLFDQASMTGWEAPLGEPFDPAQSTQWHDLDVLSPDLTDLDTVVNLARMANDAYALPGDDRWAELDRFNLTLPFGWDDGGLRGHVFADPANQTVVVSFKGTTIDSGRGKSTARLDRLNDNKLFSCCCGGLSKEQCACEKRGFLPGRKPTCLSMCVRSGLYDSESYYPEAIKLYLSLLSLYPDAQFWLTGHSLGGSLASLLGLTFGLPTVTFEAVPDRLSARRLGLPIPADRAFNPVTHVWHTGDVIATGNCRGPFSVCGRAGYSIDSVCHQGNLIIYRTVEKWGWPLDRTTRSHTIQYAIDNVYSKPWNQGETDESKGRERDWTDVPVAEGEEVGCEDCAGWTYV